MAVALLGVIAGWLYYHDGTPDYYQPTITAAPPRNTLREASGPLRVHEINPRYFADGQGAPVLLSGSHTWSNFQDNGLGYPPRKFDYEAYLDFLVENNHNFTRLWSWEQSRWAPTTRLDEYFFFPGPPYERTGPGIGIDGKLRFDLDRLDPTYFRRLRDRVAAAEERGIYVAIVLFNGWSIDNAHANLRLGNGWMGHPFNRANNVNGIDGDPNRDESGEETHTLQISRIAEYQEAYVRRVVDTVNEFDNVLYEISNESYSNSRDWQYHLIELIHKYEADKPKQHPVGMTQYQWPGRNVDLWNGPADWVAPWEELPDFPYLDNPRPSLGTKIVVVDTDHLWGIGGDRHWAWKSFLRGNHLLFMDAYDGAAFGVGARPRWDLRIVSWRRILKDILGLAPRPVGWQPNNERWTSLRANLGYILDIASRVNLAKMVPRPDLASTGYCLAAEDGIDTAYIAYIEASGGCVEIDISGYSGLLQREWLNPESGEYLQVPPIVGGRSVKLCTPFKNDSVLFLYAE